MNSDLKKYIENEILPKYNNFDHGHDMRHVKAVIERSIEYASSLNEEINLDMVYTIASYHDVGMVISRENHAKHSRDFALNDKNLRKFFSEEQINIIADACEDHSTSSKREPRTIYGKIVSDADKDIDVDVGLKRGFDYSLFHYPEFTFEEHLENIYQQIKNRFGENGTVKLYLDIPKLKKFKEEFSHLIDDKEELRERLLKIYSLNN